MHRADDDQAQRRVVDGDEAAVLLGARTVGLQPGIDGGVLSGGDKLAGPTGGVGDHGHGATGGARFGQGGQQGLGKRLIAIAHGFDQHADRAATGQARRKGGLVVDAEGQDAGPTVLQGLQRLGHHGAFDTAPGNRADHLAGARDGKLAARLPGRGPPGFDHRGQGSPLPGAVPGKRGFGDQVMRGAGHGPSMRRR